MNRGMLIVFSILCVVAGISGYVADTYLNIEYVGGFSNVGPVITIIVIAVCSAIALTASTMAFRTGKYLVSVLCFVGFVSAVCWSAPVSLSRIASSVDSKTVKRDSHIQKREMLQKAYEEVKNLRAQEAKKGGCGKNCQALVKREGQLLAEITNLGLPQDENSAGSRLAYVIPFLDAKTVEMVVPISAVISLTCLMNGLLVFGLTNLFDLFSGPKPIVDKKNIFDGSKIIPEKRSVDNVKLESKNLILPNRNDKNDPILKYVESMGEVTLSDVAKQMDRSLPFVSTYVSDLERRGLLNKRRAGRRVFISTP